MVKLTKFMGFLVFFIIALSFFMPKESLYYYGEKELQKHKVIVSNEEVIDNGLSLTLNHATVSYDAINSAEVEKIEFNFFVFYNYIEAQNIKLSDMAASFLPLQIDTVEIKYSILNPLEITADARGEFGEANARMYILDRNISVLLEPSDLMKKKYRKTLTQFKKDEEGSYSYAKTF